MARTVLVCGSRDWLDRYTIRRVLKTLPKGTRIVHGDCRGADRIAGAVATYLKMPVKAYPADWKKHGKAAGPIRNQQMLDEEDVSSVLAFHEDLKRSKGTRDMVARARKAGISVLVVSSPLWPSYKRAIR